MIRAGAIPIDESVLSSRALEADPLRLALNGGEEYELLFTARPENSRRVAELSTALGVAITAVGEIVDGEGLQLERDGKLEPVKASGYEHMI